METETINSLLPATITLIVTSLFGLLVGILTEKFKNRLRTITYEIYTQNLKPNLSKNLIGNLKISLNEREIDSLRSAYVEFEHKNNVHIVYRMDKINHATSQIAEKIGASYLESSPKNTANEKTYFNLYEQVRAKLKEEPFRFELPYFISKLQAFV